MKEDVAQKVGQAVAEAVAEAGLHESFDGSIEILLPKEERFGDFSTNVAMILAARLKKNPRQIADAIVARLAADPLFTEASVAGPGFINLRVAPAAWIARLGDLSRAGETWGRSAAGGGEKVMVEFVSANPTGPLHIGHGRGAAVGDAIARILSAAGYDVTAEYYINDVGLQMDNLGRSLLVRARELTGRPVEEEPTYKGDYLKETARAFLEEKGAELLDLPADELLPVARDYAAISIMDGIKEDLADFRVRFDTWFSEATLHAADEVERTIEAFQAAGRLYEHEGALWLKTADYGDEKDRVVRRGNGGPTTYLAADMAYHKNKFDRGFTTVVDIWGADHHGYIPRMKAVIGGLGHDPEALKVLLVQIVNLKRGGELVAMSTRSGVFTTLREIMDEVGVDATRFFFLMRSSDSQLDFDVDLAKSQSDENPVYYVQYAHARCANIFRKAAEERVQPVPFDQIDPAFLDEEDALRLIRKLASFPEQVVSAARHFAPWFITQYLMETATLFHRFYKNHRVVTENIPQSQARLALVSAVRTTLANGLGLLGITAPDRM
ncbi:MAG: arginine--tRNA ligase [Nitrospinae bacterium]|nr:arginine--tRNA ligase [Nitrospinota bacterium]